MMMMSLSHVAEINVSVFVFLIENEIFLYVKLKENKRI